MCASWDREGRAKKKSVIALGSQTVTHDTAQRVWDSSRGHSEQQKGRGEIRIVKKWVMMRLFRVISQWRSPKHLFFIFLHLFQLFFACSCHWMRDLCDKHTLLLMRKYRISSRSRRTSKRKVVVCRSSSRKMLRSLDELFVERVDEWGGKKTRISEWQGGEEEKNKLQ